MRDATRPLAALLFLLAGCSVYDATLGDSSPDGSAGHDTTGTSGTSSTDVAGSTGSGTAGSSVDDGTGGPPVTTTTGSPGAGGGTTGSTGSTGASGVATSSVATSGTGGSVGSGGAGSSSGGSGSSGVTGGAAGKGGAGPGASGAGGSAGSAATGVGGSAGKGGATGSGNGGSPGASGVGGSAGSASGVGGSTGGSATGNGGSTGSGGGAGGGTIDAGPPGICNYANPITLLYRNVTSAAGGNVIDFAFKIVNGGAQPLALSTLTARYYLTNDIVTPTATPLYGNICCPDLLVTTHVRASIVPIGPPVGNADTYIEISFDATAGTLAPLHEVEVEVEYTNAGRASSNQLNDYSFTAAATGTQAQWDACPGASCTQFRSCLLTVYQGGALIWGNPPK